jgi:hypothetical protein
MSGRFLTDAEATWALIIGLMLMGCVITIVYGIVQLNATMNDCRARGGVWLTHEGVCVKMETIPVRP